MRIIGGTVKSRRLKLPKVSGLRPTLDNVRESLFNILGPAVEGKTVVDLYAGSGSLGIEALSRGAQSAVFVDNNPACIRVIEDNLNSVNLRDRAILLSADVGQALADLSRQERQFGLTMLDPPYGSAKKSLKDLAKSAIVKSPSLVVVEHYKKEELPGKIGILTIIKTTRYGDTCLSFYAAKK